MERLEIEFNENKNGEILAQVINFPSKDTLLSQKDIYSLIEDLMLASTSIDEISDLNLNP
ncbi:MAG: hypothetical protein QM500_05990 [Methylococcales bacterium]